MIERPHEIQFAKWLPRRAAFVSLEDDGKVYIIVSLVCLCCPRTRIPYFALGHFATCERCHRT